MLHEILVVAAGVLLADLLKTISQKAKFFWEK